MNDVTKSIEKYNEGRLPALLQLKYKSMRRDIFRFYRGTAHLFYKRIRTKDILYSSPSVWICGDLHFENFGSFKGDNGLVYFDINDFDESTLAPCLFDIARFIISLQLITELAEMKQEDSDKLCQLFLDVYCSTLLTGNSRWVEKETAIGLVKQLLKKVSKRKPIAQVYSEKKGKSRELDFNLEPLIKPNKEEKAEITHLIAQWNKHHHAKALYDIIDIAYHLKGTGSLGLKRYVLMVQNKSNKKFKLIDLKIAKPSCVHPSSRILQPTWNNEAERIIAVQRRVQGTSQALLKSVEANGKSYVLREYQSVEDKINYGVLKGKVANYIPVITTMAQVTAWGQLQSGGREGSAITDELISFAKQQKK
ncbi:MAG TPA: DUF2252 family protein, partial [Cytophagaceae bacterium]|nr:DUF2252 family protein [Cytophagaceae bacterium]